jgi:hypothetical protein
MILGYVNCGKGAEGFGPISTNTTGLKVGLNICKDGILAQTGHVHEAEAGRSDLNATLQQQRKETGVKKRAVCTWIEVNIGCIHWDGFQMIENLCKTKGVVWAYEWIVGYQMHDVDEEEKVFCIYIPHIFRS